jgi:hypothetical protein
LLLCRFGKGGGLAKGYFQGLDHDEPYHLCGTAA